MIAASGVCSIISLIRMSRLDSLGLKETRSDKFIIVKIVSQALVDIVAI